MSKAAPAKKRPLSPRSMIAQALANASKIQPKIPDKLPAEDSEQGPPQVAVPSVKSAFEAKSIGVSLKEATARAPVAPAVPVALAAPALNAFSNRRSKNGPPAKARASSSR